MSNCFLLVWVTLRCEGWGKPHILKKALMLAVESSWEFVQTQKKARTFVNRYFFQIQSGLDHLLLFSLTILILPHPQGLYPSIEFLCVEHTRNLSLPPPPKSISVVWKSQNISLTLTSRRRSCVSRDTKRVRSSTQRERNMRSQSSTRLIRKQWTHKFCEESKLSLSSGAISALCLLSQMEFTLTK